MRTKLFFILCLSSLYGFERKHSLEMDIEESSQPPKKFKGKIVRKTSNVGWEDGFAQGILYSWKHAAEKTALTCGCWIIDRHTTEHFYDLLRNLGTEFHEHDGKKVIVPLIQYLKNTRYLLGGTNSGLIPLDAILTSPVHIRPILLSYNTFVESLNHLHAHDFRKYELPYYS